MRTIRHLALWIVLFSLTQSASSQFTNRISYNNQQVFLNGANLPWISYSHDVGIGKLDTVTIADWMLQVHQHGGNAVRWWIHTDGQASPSFGSNYYVNGPGTTTIADIKKVLDLAWEREISVQLCLWSFGMLNKALGTDTIRNRLLLTDTSFTNAYIRNCLIPLVEALKGHPAINSWEIFNEPEGMSTEYLGFGAQQLVSMTYLQRVINLCAGAIHRTDPAAQVTSGAWSFYSLSDQPLAKSGGELSKISTIEKEKIVSFIRQKYRSPLTDDEIIDRLQKITAMSYNWYRDDRLIAEGGDLLGTLDFYSVHFYSTINSTPDLISPFVHAANTWNLNKAIVVGEFAMENAKGAPTGVPAASMYDTLYQLGYAGALAWSWSEEYFSSHAHMEAGMQAVWDKHRTDVDILGTGADFPYVNIAYPLDGSSFPDSNQVTFQISVTDSSDISSVDIIIGDTLTIAHLTSAPYNFTWTNIAGGIYRIKAIASNILGHKQTSSSIQITVGTPTMKRLEAETAIRKGSGMAVVSEVTASGKKYVDITTNDTSASITWKLTSVPVAGSYPITFGYRLAYQSPKTQHLNINGVHFSDIEFTAPAITNWYEKTINVSLIKDTNTIQLQMFWGWMYLDYLAVPAILIPSTSVDGQQLLPLQFSLQQNYPNPFNPITTINFSLPKASRVKLTVYNTIGQNVATLIDENLNAGRYSKVFDASKFASGVYFYRLSAGNFSIAKKMILIK